MITIPILRWGKPYDSLEKEDITHYATGEPVAKISRGNAGIIRRDIRKADQARKALRKIPIHDLVKRAAKAGELYLNGTLPLGDGSQTAEEFVKAQSSTTGMPENMCRANMQKNHFVLAEMENILEALTRGLDLEVLQRGYGEERGVTVSFQAQAPALGLVLPSNSPGVHTLWLPVIPMQVGLLLKPGSQEPWTPYRLTAAFIEAGIPPEAISVFPGPTEMGAALLETCPRSLIFGGAETIQRYAGNPRVQAHGPGFSKVLIAEDKIDNWEEYVDLLVESIYSNGGRSCINCSSIWVPRHGRAIAEAIAERLGKIEPLGPEDPEAGLAAFTNPAIAKAVSGMIDNDLTPPGVEEMTAKYHPNGRLIEEERYAHLLPTLLYSNSPEPEVCKREYMFPFSTVVECPQEEMLKRMGPTLICTAITDNPELRNALLDSTEIDRINLGPIATNRINWLQPHEGNIVDFLYRSRACQIVS
ncbi:Putative succinate-semialdehyde dehydrogenase [NADP(+)] 2 [Planctomycetes bacterium Pan216]|uniref:Succinate-semialdehyde dehydrogenase [NADP(+)] 2 n=1 Tax=Kolteria novifilia TaxID=2527975 RepID=A0A518AYA4_9BACT|nr:Putative succinate-semialdehyde dehydrogenase [NADP(+)] 2 [Planctomycetes bacterium Pan216]